MHVSESPRTSPVPGPVLVRGIAELWTGAARLRDAAVLLDGAHVAWVGPDAERPAAATVWEADGLCVTPGLVDCHTHTVWAGSRVQDFTRRLAGESYAAILEAGGGIHSTVRATTAASEAELVALARARLGAMAARGVTTVEVKSGYGLHLEPELRMLRAARAAAGEVQVVTTYLAHVLPPGVDRAAWVEHLVEEQLPAVVGLADAVDVYCDRGAFTLAEAARVLGRAKALGLAVKAHAEQVEHTGVAALAAGLGALSVDHLERLDDAGVAALAKAGTVAVLLPGAMLYLRDSPPPVARLRAAGVPLAVATDLNPGSSPVDDLWAAATLACLTMGLSVEEALAGITSVGARALGLRDRGWLGPGARADLAFFAPPPGEVADLGVFVQHLGGPRAVARVCGGRWVG